MQKKESVKYKFCEATMTFDHNMNEWFVLN